METNECVTTLNASRRSGLLGRFDAELMTTRPHLFSDVCVSVTAKDQLAMAEFVAAMEQVAAHPDYRAAVCSPDELPPRAWPKARSVCMGYDFHMTEEGPKLIEINTNAGGLVLMGDLMNAWGQDGESVLRDALEMFLAEWQVERGDVPLKTIAIVDVDPLMQYLAPELERYRELFLAHGIDAVLVDPRDLVWQEGALYFEDRVIDLVYNRLTDFNLVDPANIALANAWLADAVVVTPHPFAHRLFANKRNLVILSDPDFRARLNLSASHEAAMAAVLLSTRDVRREDAEALWSQRKKWFFKPAAGFGGRAAYRGDKMTRRVFEEIIAAGSGAYVAQEYAAPHEVDVRVNEGIVRLKCDVRSYAYGGHVQTVAARLYQGQTTNFRTIGGGFAPVVRVA